MRFKIANGKVGVSLAGNLKGNLWTDFHDFDFLGILWYESYYGHGYFCYIYQKV